MNFGVTLSNRGVLVGLTTPKALLQLADAVEASPHMDWVWCGDALFVNRRLDALTLLAAVAGRTERVLLGPACMGSFALRNPMVLAYEWASLDVISDGRTRMVACSGGGTGPIWEAETQAMGYKAEDRHKLMVEAMAVMRHLWTKDNEPFEGQFFKFKDLTLRAQARAVAVPVVDGDQRRPRDARRGADGRLRLRPEARRPHRRRLDDALGQPRGLHQVLGDDPRCGQEPPAAIRRNSTTCSITTSMSARIPRPASPTARSSSISTTAPTTPASASKAG